MAVKLRPRSPYPKHATTQASCSYPEQRGTNHTRSRTCPDTRYWRAWGKRVLRGRRPGADREPPRRRRYLSGDVLEIAPGLGTTASSILERTPRSYLNVDDDPTPSRWLGTRRLPGTCDRRRRLGDRTRRRERRRRYRRGDAHDAVRPIQVGDRRRGFPGAATGRPVFDPQTRPEPRRPPRRGQDRAPQVAGPVDRGQRRTPSPKPSGETCSPSPPSRSPRCGARGWRFPKPRRVIADEVERRTLRFVANLIRDGDARARVLAMRSTFTKYKSDLAATEVIATEPVDVA